MRPGHTHSRTTGFSLVELMVALVAGMVVVGAMLTFTVASVRANSEFVMAARLTQQLRTVSQYIGDELRRSGYDENAMSYISVSSATEVSEFAPVLVDTSSSDAHCIVYAYDRKPGNPGQIDLDNAEVRAVRRATVTIDGESVGVIEVGESSGTTAPTCDGASPDYDLYPVPCASSGWCAFSDPRSIDIESFTVNVGGVADNSHGRQTLSSVTSGFMPMQIREAQVTLVGHLRSDDAVSRTIVSNVKIRANCLRALISDCNVAPTP